MEVKINSAQRPFPVALAENHGDMPVQRNAVTQLWAAAFVSLDGLVHERLQDSLKLVRRFINANDKLIVRFKGGADFRPEHFNIHNFKIAAVARQWKCKNFFDWCRLLLRFPLAM